MLIDARTLGESETFTVDICVIGAGPAGITFAREFNGHSLNVLLLESGGFKPEPAVEDLSKGSREGDPYPAPHELRERGVGGTARV